MFWVCLFSTRKGPFTKETLFTESRLVFCKSTLVRRFNIRSSVRRVLLRSDQVGSTRLFFWWIRCYWERYALLPRCIITKNKFQLARRWTPGQPLWQTKIFLFLFSAPSSHFVSQVLLVQSPLCWLIEKNPPSVANPHRIRDLSSVYLPPCPRLKRTYSPTPPSPTRRLLPTQTRLPSYLSQ